MCDGEPIPKTTQSMSDTKKIYKYDGEPIPGKTRSMSDKQKKGIDDANKLVAYVEEGLASGSLPMHNGLLNRKKLADLVGFGRSAYQQNPHIEKVTVWAEKQLGQAPKTGGSGGGQTERERELASENERLKNRNVALKIERDEAISKLRKLGYMEMALESGDARLPW
jgi:hypothetical protein